MNYTLQDLTDAQYIESANKIMLPVLKDICIVDKIQVCNSDKMVSYAIRTELCTSLVEDIFLRVREINPNQIICVSICLLSMQLSIGIFDLNIGKDIWLNIPINKDKQLSFNI